MPTSSNRIEYEFFDSRFGQCLIARSSKGICHLEFFDHNPAEVLRRLERDHPDDRLRKSFGTLTDLAESIFDMEKDDRPVLHLQGTEFQIAVWQALLEIPAGSTVSYQQIAERIDRPRAIRAVANAVASNHLAYLIPCHRVIRSNGELGGYRWGIPAMLAWEQDEVAASESYH